MFNQSPEVLSQQFLPAGGVPLAHIVIDGSHDLVGELQPCSKRIRLQFKTDRTQYRTAHAHWPHQTELLAGIEIGDGGIESAALFLLKLLIKALCPPCIHLKSQGLKGALRLYCNDEFLFDVHSFHSAFLLAFCCSLQLE